MIPHDIRRGLDIPIAGAASGDVVDLPIPATVGIDPREIAGLIPRLAAREGDTVQAGQPVMYHKFDQDTVIVAPVGGRIREVRRGARRVITGVVIETDASAGVVQHRAWTAGELAGISRDDARAQLLAGGVWPFLRTRPLDRLAPSDVVPQAIVIAATETGPLQPGASVLLSEGDKDALQAAIHALGALTDGTVYLTVPAGSSHPALSGLDGVEVHAFSGPHPSGDPGVQVNHLCPPSGGRTVLTLRAWDAVTIGRLFLTGRFDPSRVIAAVGTGVKAPRLVRTVLGAPVADVAGALADGPQRIVCGSILTGRATPADGFTGFFPRAMHVLPDVVERTILGWANPFNGMWSFHKAFLAAFGASRPQDLRPGVYGGHRAIVPTGVHDKVIASPDILPTFLFRSMIAGDLEGSVKLGMLDITMEEAALASFICPSKIDYDEILRERLELYAKEA